MGKVYKKTGMLEYWNDGIMGNGIMGFEKMRRWSIGKISLDREVNNCVTSFKNQHSIIPPFYYSMREAKTQTSKTSYIFNTL